MPKKERKPQDVLLLALCTHGLKMRPADLTEKERTRQLATINRLVEEYDVASIFFAIRDGMPEVWPYSDGRPFDASDLATNMLKARAAASDKQRRGESYHQFVPGDSV